MRLTGGMKRNRERGAITTVVSLLLGLGVLLGSSAMVLDVGQLYAEREDLQSGADAASLALAATCAHTPSTCAVQATTASTGLADRYASANAHDGAAAVTVACGRGSGLTTCPAPATNRTACIGTIPATMNYVEVRTATETADGKTVLPPFIAQALPNPGGYQGTRVAACARAAWGTPASAVGGLAVTLSYCEWSDLTANGTLFAPSPTQSLPSAGYEGVIKLHDSHGTGTCPAGPSGWDAPGGFGWLDDPTSTCTTTVSSGGTYGGDTGNSASHACQDALSNARTAHTTIVLPVYDGVKGNGANTTYHLAGYAAFVLTGYKLSGSNSESSWLTGRDLCSGSDRCLYGYFTRAILPLGAPGTGTSYGVTTVGLIG
jgi:hypothetical protein